ncbi:hypothetical protein [Devosia lacusdianchii]|uniref:hypothetical protein n=1 Tax=Devosia lacusdianchii TaxID=2917991 RepID=UPI001F067FCF|nr:hypothetical protein [Devosia sp. JXJ CY 41]
MALANPLAIADFYDRFRVQDVTFVQGPQQQRSATGGGETRYADRAPSLWKADVTTQPLLNAEAEGIMALINSRGGGLKTVLLYNSRLPYPSSDPKGQIIGATVPKLGVITDRLHVAFTGFPAGYLIPLGTYFSIQFDTSRFYLGQFAEARTANPITGTVGATEVWPPLPASISGTPDVVIVKPPAKFRIEPGSAFLSKEGGLHSTIKFSAEQTYSR